MWGAGDGCIELSVLQGTVPVTRLSSHSCWVELKGRNKRTRNGGRYSLKKQGELGEQKAVLREEGEKFKEKAG